MKTKSILNNTVFLLQVLLVFLVVFESFVSIPPILQPLGRMHPLILHFPIVLIVLLFFFTFFRNKLQADAYDKLLEPLVIITSLVTSLTAIFGFFLSLEGEYSGQLLSLHKWTGIGLSFTAYGLLLFIKRNKIFRILSFIGIALVLVTGHLGASITHGKDFLWEPLLVKTIKVNPQTTLYDAVIYPMLDAKCTSCHNASRIKGDLDMTHIEGMIKGGENGQVIVEGNSEESELIKRVLLPEDHEDRMPAEGKTGLSTYEISLLKHWIDSGAEYDRKLEEYPPSDSLYVQAIEYIQSKSKKVNPYSFDAADQALIRSLNNPYRTVRQYLSDGPALDVGIFVAESYQTEHLSGLSDVSTQIVSLNLSYMPVSDEELSLIANFNNLEKLVLNFTSVTDDGISKLGELPKLKSLALAGTAVSAEILNILERFPALESIYLWNTGIETDDIKNIVERFPELNVEMGYQADEDESLQIGAPVLGNLSNILQKGESISFNHPLSETRIFYTLDGSNPDSSSNQYLEPFVTDKITEIKAIAYKKGWLPSKLAEFSFFRKGFTPENITLLKLPNEKYPGKGASTLFDDKKGEISSFQSPEWLGFRESPMDILIDFGEKAPSINHVVVGYGLNVASYIMKPVFVEVYGGNSKNNLELLKRKEILPSKEYEPPRQAAVDISTGSTSYRYYRLVAQPISRLPEWHAGKGDKGWVFVDELFFY